MTELMLYARVLIQVTLIHRSQRLTAVHTLMSYLVKLSLLSAGFSDSVVIRHVSGHASLILEAHFTFVLWYSHVVTMSASRREQSLSFYLLPHVAVRHLYDHHSTCYLHSLRQSFIPGLRLGFLTNPWTFSSPTGLIPWTRIEPFNVFILLNRWICLHGIR